MAQSTAFKTYDDSASMREDLMDVITNISPEDTPMLTMFKQVKVNATLAEWQTESLTAAGSNAAIEAADYSFTLPGGRTRVTNNTQIFTKTWEISGSDEAVNKAGIESEYARRVKNAFTEMARDVEYALVNGTGNSGSSGTARTLKGVLSFITTNVETGSGTGTQALTSTLYNGALQTIYGAGGNPDTAFVNAWQKRQISGFTTPLNRNIDADSKAFVATIDVYESDFGRQVVKLDRWMSTDVVALLEVDKWAVGTLRPIAEDPNVAKVGDARRGAAVGELTLVAYNEAASGKVIKLTTS